MFAGLIYGLGAGALWALTFVGAPAVAPASLYDLTLARYAVFAGLSVLAMAAVPAWRPTGLGVRRIVLGLGLGGVGYAGYFIAVTFAVKWAGAAVPPLIIGLMPPLLAVIGNRRRKVVAWRRLVLPLFLVTAGIVLVNVAALRHPGIGDHVAAGILASFVALGIWVVWAVLNEEVIVGANPPHPVAWAGLQGIGSLLFSLVLVPFSVFAHPSDPGTVLTPRFIVWAVLLGAGAGWGATFLWNRASKVLPLALTAQLIVSETLFGLFYGFVMVGRLPDLAEVLGALAQLAGTSLALARALRRDAGPASSIDQNGSSTSIACAP